MVCQFVLFSNYSRHLKFHLSRDWSTYCIDNNLWIAIFAKFRQAASSDNSQITIERHKHQHEYWYEHVHVKNLNINFFPVNFVIKDRAICQIEFKIKLTELLSQQATSPKIQSVVGFRIFTTENLKHYLIIDLKQSFV